MLLEKLRETGLGRWTYRLKGTLLNLNI